MTTSVRLLCEPPPALRWIVHIGAQKTGSKALQSFFLRELRRLQGVSGFYPTKGRSGGWHEPLYYELLAGDTSALRAAVSEAEQQAVDLAILSYERMFDLPPAAIRNLRQNLGSAQIVLFVRRQDQVINSYYNQLIKAHRTTIEDIELFEAEIGSYQPYFDYRAIIKKWSNTFGRDNMTVIIYDKSQSSVRKFFDRLVLPVNYDGYRPVSRNLALDAQAISILRHIKTLVRDKSILPIVVEAAHEALANRLIDTYTTGEYYLIDEPTRRCIVTEYEQCNQWVRERYFDRLPRLFAPVEPGGGPGQIDLSYGRDVALQIIESATGRGSSSAAPASGNG
jgi:hypothetical protein